jgi:predicted hydrocarbon binding protein
MHEEMIRILGSGAFTILWHIGLNEGKMLIELIKKFAPLDFSLKGENLLIAFKQLYQAAGWGIIEYVDVDEKQKTGKIRVYHSIGESVTQKYNESICYYTKGHLTALLQEIFNCQTVYIDEIKCMAMGYKYCEFRFEC